MDKAHFIREELFICLSRLHADKKPVWGKMNAQQMVEHLALFVGLSTEKIHFPLAVVEEELPKYKSFLMSDKMFRENTKAPASVLDANPLPEVFDCLDTSIEKLKEAIDEFFSFFTAQPDKTTLHPAFGWLNYEEWLMLHYKHAHHHLRQFQLL